MKLPVESAQAAELIALMRACVLAKNKTVTIYTDSKYAFSAAHDFSKIWKNRGFVKTVGKPIQHATLIKELLAAMMLPSQISVGKCAGHAEDNSAVATGSNFADLRAEEAALHADFPPWMTSTCVSASPSEPPLTAKDLLKFWKASHIWKALSVLFGQQHNWG